MNDGSAKPMKGPVDLSSRSRAEPRITSVLATTFVLIGSTISVQAEQMNLVDQFVHTCIGSLPDFEDVSAELEGTEFAEWGDNRWKRDTDNAVIEVKETQDTLQCSAALIGKHADEFQTQLEDHLQGNKLGPFEKRNHQGRQLYLLQTTKGLTFLEVIPPRGALTFIVANARKE